MKKLLLLFVLMYAGSGGFAQFVGIGTTTPTRPLTIRGVGTAPNPISQVLAFHDLTDAPRWHIDMPDLVGLNFAATNIRDNVLYLGINGRTGINNGNPSATLHVISVEQTNSTVARFHRGEGNADLRISNPDGELILQQTAVGANLSSSNGNNLWLRAGTANGGAELHLLPNGHVGIGSGLTNPLSPLHVSGEARLDGGILLPAGGGVRTPLNHYETAMFSGNWVFGNNTYAVGYVVRVVRTGNMVCVTLTADNTTMNATGALELVYNTALPARFRPANTVRQPIQVQVNGTLGTGVLQVRSDGTIAIRPSISGPAALWSGTANSGLFACSIFYVIP